MEKKRSGPYRLGITPSIIKLSEQHAAKKGKQTMSVTGIQIGAAVRRYMKRYRKNIYSPLTKIDEAIYALLCNHRTFAAEHEAMDEHEKLAADFYAAQEPKPYCWRQIVCLGIALQDHFPV